MHFVKKKKNAFCNEPKMGKKKKYHTFMLLKFFLYVSRFWKRAAANGETSRRICDIHSISLNKVSI